MQLKTVMYAYQQEAFDKLKGLKVGALYMEMGTGKTRVTLQLIKHRKDRRKIKKVLWLCPCSVRENLRADIIVHCGEMPDFIRIEGIESVALSDGLYLDLLEYVKAGDVMLVVDESNMVKNHKAKRTERITMLAERLTYKIILNGTPVSRNEADLFAQWYILDWRILGYKSYYSFAANHIEYWTVRKPGGREIRTNHVKRVLDVEYLTQKIALFSYQIKKSETGIELPDKVHHSEWFELPSWQVNIYEATRDAYCNAFVDDLDDTAIYKMFTALSHVTSGRRVTSQPLQRMRTKDMFDDISENPRIVALERILREEIKDEKAIIFVKYQKEAEEIMELLRRMEKTAALFTGKLTMAKREESLAAFRNDTQYLIANKQCGAYGLNLQFCHNIIFYNNDFDYATRAQAEDRIHRLGQTQTCHIYDIYACDTLDTFILDNLDKKDGLVHSFKGWLEEYKRKKLKANGEFVDKDKPKPAA